MHWYQMEGLYLWTKLQNARRKEENPSLSKTSIFKHLAASEEIRVTYHNSSKYVVTSPGDYFLESLRESNPRAIISITRLSIQF